MKPLTFQEKYAVIGKQGTHYEGMFVTAVKSTGIFCRPSCRARKPNIENVIFYDTAQQALQNGFRPCKICRPMEKLDEMPVHIAQLIRDIQLNPTIRLKDADLRKRHIEPHQLRRWFKKHHNMTFHTYQRMLRINCAFTDIKQGNSITNSALNSGYESLSGFNQRYRSILGEAPSDSLDKTIINITRLTTPIGPMFACASPTGVCLLDFTDRRMLETLFADLCKRLNGVILPGNNQHLTQLQNELEEYFNGQRTVFDVALHISGTEFQQSVWQQLLKIPYGETRTYTQQALAVNKPAAIRAVGTANGRNKISIIIPCHRVIASDGGLAGYGGGLTRKKWLLEFENKYFAASTKHNSGY